MRLRYLRALLGNEDSNKDTVAPSLLCIAKAIKKERSAANKCTHVQFCRTCTQLTV